MKRYFFILSTLLLSLYAIAEESFANRLAQKGTIIVGTEGTYPPFTYHDATGELTGYDVEVTRALGKVLGVTVEFKEAPWNALLAGLNQGRFDAVANQVSMHSKERQAKYAATAPYSYSYAALAVKASSPINSLAEVKGQHAGLAFTSNFADLLRDKGAIIEPVEGGLAQEVQLVAQGRMDLTLNDRLAVLYYQRQLGDDRKLRVIDLPDEGKVSAGLVVRKADQAVVEKINQAMQELRDSGELAKISQQFFGVDVSVP